MSLAQEYQNVRQKTTALCETLHPEDCNLQASEFVSPPKWHLAHTSWFFEEFILKKTDGYKEFHPKFGFLFNSYYNNIGERVARPNRGLITRPVLSEVLEYRNHVDRSMTDLLNGDKSQNYNKLVILGLNHEQQHQELLLTDIKYSLHFNPLFPALFKSAPENRVESQAQEWIRVPAGMHSIGSKGEGFAFDNEFGIHEVYLNDFEISDKLVTNAEFIEFIEDDGYRNFNLWLDEAWYWIQENAISNPLYWKFQNGKWQYFTLAGLQDINMDAPVSHISYYEASAFAAWKEMRLPTEFEWEAAADHLNWGLRWEWTNSAYLAYPGFSKEPGAVGEYNGKFMINQMVLRGGSVATAENHSRKSYRNFFHPASQWQFSGIRLVKN